nr:putative reverse transcriptase, RNA-dependent DNA polymerase [Tanacetum cinerariifolium]
VPIKRWVSCCSSTLHRNIYATKPDLVFHDAPNVNKIAHTAFNVKLSPTKPEKDLSHTHGPLTPIIEDWVSNSEDDSEAEISQNAPSFVQPTEQVKTPRPSIKTIETSIPTINHKTAIPKPKNNGNHRNRKACFVCKSLDHLIKDYDFYENKMAQTHFRNHAQRGHHQQYARMTLPNPQRYVVPSAVLTKSKLVPIHAEVPKPHVTRPRQAKTVVTKSYSPPRRHINRSPSPKASTFPLKFTAAEAPMGNPQHALKDKGVIDSGCSRHMTGNMSYLSNFEELNSRYVTFGGNPKGGKISGKDENQVLLRVPKENNMYNVDLKNIVPFGDLTCLFAKATLDESNLWHGRMGHINFKTMNKLVKGKFHGKVDEGFLVGYSVSSKAFRNTDGDAAFEVKVLEFEGRNPQSKVYVSLSSSSQTKKHDDKTKREVKELEDMTYSDDEEDAGTEADFTNLETSITVSPILTTRVHKDHHVTQIIGDLSLATQTRSMLRVAQDQVDLPHGKRDIGTKWVFRNKKDEKGIVVRNKARLVAQGHTQEKGIDYEEVFAPVTRIEAIRFFLAYASFMGFMVYQMDVKSAFLYETIKKEDLRTLIILTRFIKWSRQYMDYIKLLELDGKSASTPIDTEKPLHKDSDGEDVDVYTYRSMIGSLMYLTSSRPDILFTVCACARFQVTPKVLHLHAVKRIFRYRKGKPHLGLWYPKDSPFNLVAYSDSDYAGASLDRKSTTGGCQFFGFRLISWQCKKQTVVATLSINAEYVAAASCCAQVLWIQNQLLYYGYNFMHTIIYIDNSSAICIIKNLVLHSKIKHIEIRHHFIRDRNDKKLIQVVKIPSDNNLQISLLKLLMLEDFDTWLQVLDS